MWDSRISSMNIKLLPKILKKNGFIYEQIERRNPYAIYAQKYTLDAEPIAYEVFQIQVRGSKEFRGKIIPPYESIASKFGLGTKRMDL